jgi:hypothetical protein
VNVRLLVTGVGAEKHGSGTTIDLDEIGVSSIQFVLHSPRHILFVAKIDLDSSLTVGKKLFRNNGQIAGVKKFLALHSPGGDNQSSRMVAGMATPTA